MFVIIAIILSPIYFTYRLVKKSFKPYVEKQDRSDYIEFGIGILFIIVCTWINRSGYSIWPVSTYGFIFEQNFLIEMTSNNVRNVGLEWLNIQRNTFILSTLNFIVIAIRLPKVLNKNYKKLASLHPRKLDAIIPSMLITLVFSTFIWIYFAYGLMENVVQMKETSLSLIVFLAFFINSAVLCFYFSLIYSVMFYRFGLKK